VVGLFLRHFAKEDGERKGKLGGSLELEQAFVWLCLDLGDQNEIT